jgi:hypothetical protein
VRLDAEELMGVWWHELWVPFAATHDTVGCLFVDTRPGPRHGAVGYFFHESGGKSGRWPSLAAFAGDVAGAFEETRPTRLDVPRLASAHSAPPVLPAVQDGALSWRQ